MTNSVEWLERKGMLIVSRSCVGFICQEQFLAFVFFFNLAKQIIHCCCFSCMAACSWFQGLVNDSYMNVYMLYAPKCFLYLLNILPDDCRVRSKLVDVFDSPSLFWEALLCWHSSLPAFALSCPQTGGFLPPWPALWCLPRYHCRYRKPGTSFLRPSQDVCIAWKFSRCQLCFLMNSDMVAPRRKVHPSAALPEGDQSFVLQTRESMQPFSHCIQNKEVLP